MNTKQLQPVSSTNVKATKDVFGTRADSRRTHGKTGDRPFQLETPALSGSERIEQEAMTCCEWAIPPAKNQTH
jgi:hypothetical protein